MSEPKNIADRIMAAIDRANAPTPSPTFEQLAKTIVATSAPLARKDELAALREFQTQHETAQKVIADHTIHAAKTAWLENQKNLQLAVRGGTEGLTRHEGWSRVDFEEDFSQKLYAGKLDVVRVANEAAPIALKIAGRFAELANKLADEIAAREQADAERFGLPFSPSNTVSTLRSTAARALRGMGGNASPQSMLPFIQL